MKLTVAILKTAGLIALAVWNINSFAQVKTTMYVVKDGTVIFQSPISEVDSIILRQKSKNPYTPNEIPETGLSFDYTTVPYALPAHGDSRAYAPSLIGKPYLPITIQYSWYNGAENQPWSTSAETRILYYLTGFSPNVQYSVYKASVNKYGSALAEPRGTVTGRFHTQKINGRWWIIDPEGYRHYVRGVCSFSKGASAASTAAWNARFGSDAQWVKICQKEMSEIGVHATGAFSNGAYAPVRTHNDTYPDSPLTLAPSFGFLGSFKTAKGYAYPNGNVSTVVGLVFYDGWEQFCKDFLTTGSPAWIRGRTDVMGFFSDNEIDFGLNNTSGLLIRRLLNASDKTTPAYLAAKNFMESKGLTAVAANATVEINAEFAGIVAEKYYKGVKDAITELDPGMMYFGSRLHGDPKDIMEIVQAAGRYCDVISINYYNAWSPELTTRMKDWASWTDAPILITEFYTKNNDCGFTNLSGAGLAVRTIQDKAYAYQHFALGLLESKQCVGWHWFRYQDNDVDGCANGLYQANYQIYPYFGKIMRDLNYNVYALADFFDNP